MLANVVSQLGNKERHPPRAWMSLGIAVAAALAKPRCCTATLPGVKGFLREVFGVGSWCDQIHLNSPLVMVMSTSHARDRKSVQKVPLQLADGSSSFVQHVTSLVISKFFSLLGRSTSGTFHVGLSTPLLNPNSHGLQPNGDDLQPNSHGLQPN